MKENYPKGYSVKDILTDNNNWEKYKLFHEGELKDFQIAEVDSMLLCNDARKGFIVAHCKKCDKDFVTHFSCNSRICPRCGTKYVKQWVERITERMYSVDYSHIVFTLPKCLWEVIEGNWDCIGELYQMTFVVMQKIMCNVAKQKVKPGMIVVGHTFGKDIKWNVHFHNVCTEGGFTKSKLWKGIYFFPYRMMRLMWKHAALEVIKKHIGLDQHAQLAVDAMYYDYPEGFDVRRIKGKMKKKDLVFYIARYIRHPAISNRRIMSYDKKSVAIICEDKSKNISWNESFTVDAFIGRLVKHIPPKGFHVVRHYGIYSRRTYEKKDVKQDKQEIIFPESESKRQVICPFCGERANIIFFYLSKRGGKPPPEHQFGMRITDWVS